MCFFRGFDQQNAISTVEFSAFCVIVIAITSRHSCRREEQFPGNNMHKTDELRTARIDSLVTPQALADKLPISAAVADNVTASRKRIEKSSPAKTAACWW
ncbi:hypothetical protein AK51_13140 [Serratia nematodiphila DZ0503SBS1]|nr:hypothetical protein AK51_13140 [Serratia nematodiphila DZ0503SBS1]